MVIEGAQFATEAAVSVAIFPSTEKPPMIMLSVQHSASTGQGKTRRTASIFSEQGMQVAAASAFHRNRICAWPRSANGFVLFYQRSLTP